MLTLAPINKALPVQFLAAFAVLFFITASLAPHAQAQDLSDAEIQSFYEEIRDKMKAAYAKSDNPTATAFWDWDNYSRQPYQSSTHGGRYVMNFANDIGKAYGKYEEAGTLPVGTLLAKPSFAVKDGKAKVGPLFLMEKMEAGFNPDSGDWKYTLIFPNGKMLGETGGEKAAKVQFCIDCHIAVAPDQDSVFFLEEDYRVN